MRKSLALGAAMCALLWCRSAGAEQIVQTVSGTQRAGTTFDLFNRDIGTLQSVQVEGGVSWLVAMRRSLFGPLPALTFDQSAVGGLSVWFGGPFVTVPITGTEIWDEGSTAGTMLMSGPVNVTLTGDQMNVFYVRSGLTEGLLTPYADALTPHVGVIEFNPGVPRGEYGATITYNFDVFGVPEPSTWALMLLGFAGIGFAVRYSARPDLLLR